MEQWFEFKDRKVGLAAALTRYPPTRLETGVAHIGPTLRLSSHPPPIPMRVGHRLSDVPPFFQPKSTVLFVLFKFRLLASTPTYRDGG